jgi:hypothetical protein
MTKFILFVCTVIIFYSCPAYHKSEIGKVTLNGNQLNDQKKYFGCQCNFE